MPSDRAVLECAGPAFIPGFASLDEAGRERFHRIAERALASRPKSLRAGFSLFLKGVYFLPLLFYGRTLAGLSPERKTAFLERVAAAPASPLRQGLWGLKTIVFMGYYGQPELAARFSYTPSFDGNAVLDAR